MSRYFHFTIGPVQGFVAQARRTRDFWAGSFILSLLAGVAMKTVQKVENHKEAIRFPKPDPEFMSALEQGGRGPLQGSIPNRFSARVSDDFNGSLVEEAVNQAWQALAEHIRTKDLGRHTPVGSRSREIWDQQVGQFWDMAWALSDEPSESDLLDRRKNWRTYWQPEEQGPKCMIMDGWQELSGVPTPNAQDQEAFWTAVREGLRGYQKDLREGEYLSAIAFIKRRFIRHFDKGFTVDLPGGWRLRGWDVSEDVPAVPSVAYLAAVPWLRTVLDRADQRSLEAFCQTGEALEKPNKVTPNIKLWRDQAPAMDKAAKRFLGMDGNLFFETALDNERIYQERERVKPVKKALKALNKAAGCEPSPFYGVLLMDGDSLGKQMSHADRQPAITAALAEFTAGVPEKVQNHSGFLVYAGGDDVLAVLPVDTALECAAKLHRFYGECFAKGGASSTLSGAVIFAHIRVPLTRVLRDAHAVLNDIAKDQCGRDAIAVRVRNPGGDAVTWALPWSLARDGEDNGRLVVQDLAEKVRDQGRDGPYASGFFYRIRERLELLNPRQPKIQTVEEAKKEKNILGKEEATCLLAAEYLSSGIHEQKVAKPSEQEAKDIVGRLLNQCRTVERQTDEEGKPLEVDDWIDHGLWKADGALLVRFLSRKTVTRPDDREAHHD